MPKTEKFYPLLRYKNRKKYYLKHRLHVPSKKRRWDKEEVALVMTSLMTDVEISRIILRSVLAIQVVRCRIFNKYPYRVTNLFKNETPEKV